MRITDFVKRIESYTPATYTFWAGIERSMYNAEKTISNTMLLVTPRRWPSDWRPMCSHVIEFDLWFGKLIEIQTATGGTQQHKPYSSMETITALHNEANAAIAAITADSAIHVLKAQYDFFDSPDGQSVNRQIWLQCKMSVRVWNSPITFDSSIFTFDSSLITFDNG